MLEQLQAELDRVSTSLTMDQLFELCLFQKITCHIAVMKEPYIQKILSGEKTIESRFSLKRCMPYEGVEEGDVLIFKESGGPLKGIALVGKVEFYGPLEEGEAMGIIERYEDELALLEDGKNLKSKRVYVTLLHLEEVLPLLPRMLSGKKDKRSWVSICMKINEYTEKKIGDSNLDELMQFLKWASHEDPKALIREHGFLDPESRVVILDEDLFIEKVQDLTHIPRNLSIAFYYGAIPALTLKECHHVSFIEDIQTYSNGMLIAECHGLHSFKKGIRVGDILELENLPQLEYLSEDLVCKGLKLLHVPKFTFLPYIPGIRGDISIEHAVQFEGIDPEYEVIDGSLSFVSCPKMHILPKSLTLSHDFYLKECAALRTLPHYFKVGGTLNLDAPNNIEVLPAVLMVGGSASFRGCILSQLPRQVAIGGHVYIHPNTETHLVEEFFAWKEKGMIGGDVIVA